jgi:hypothetical protein
MNSDFWNMWRHVYEVGGSAATAQHVFRFIYMHNPMYFARRERAFKRNVAAQRYLFGA